MRNDAGVFSNHIYNNWNLIVAAISSSIGYTRCLHGKGIVNANIGETPNTIRANRHNASIKTIRCTYDTRVIIGSYSSCTYS